MQVILRTNIKSLGKMGDLVEVSVGYARNFLFPQKLAVEANELNLQELESKKERKRLQVEKQKKDIGILAQTLIDKEFVIRKKVGEKGKLFGSVTNKDIQDAIKEKGIGLEKRSIIIPEPIKTLGEHPVNLRLSANETIRFKIIVVAEK